MFAKLVSPARILLFVAFLLGLSFVVVWSLPAPVLSGSSFQQSPLSTASPTATRPAQGGTPPASATATRPAQVGAPPAGVTATRPITVTGSLTSTLAAPQVPVTRTQPLTATAVAPPPVPAPTSILAQPQVEPKIPGFLPPPTLSAPGSGPQPLLPGPGQPLVAPAAPTAVQRPASPDPASSSDALSLARLIDAGIVAVSYVWMCCGVLVLLGAALLLVWLARRRKQP